MEKGFHVKRNREAAESGKRQRGRAKEEEKLEANGSAGLTQVRGVYRRLMGIMG